MRGGPLNAQNITAIRPFSDTCADVSLPLPVRSRYATLFGESTRKASRPLGETFTWPCAVSGAEATKNSGCASMNACSCGVMHSTVLAILMLLLLHVTRPY